MLMRMLLLLSALALLSTVVDAQTGSSQGGVLMSAGEDRYHAKLKLTTSILDEGYCAEQRLHYLLLFKFTNVGEQKIILDRFKPVVSQYMVSGSEGAAAARKYEAHRSERKILAFNRRRPRATVALRAAYLTSRCVDLVPSAHFEYRVARKMAPEGLPMVRLGIVRCYGFCGA
jgi:hypothetical protein